MAGIDSKIADYARRGLSVRAIEKKLGGALGKTQIAERVKKLRAGPAPRPKVSTAKPTVKPSKAPVAEKPPSATTARAAPRPEVTPLTEDEVAIAVGTKDLQLLGALSERIDAKLAEVLEANEDWQALEKLTNVRLRVSKTLAEIRPPPAPDPATDPTNQAALAELRERLGRLRLPAESSLPLIHAMRAHVDGLERKANEPDDAEDAA